MLVGAGAAATLVGCDKPGTDPTNRLAGSVPDSLLVRTDGGLTYLRDGKATSYGEGIVSPTGHEIYRAVPLKSQTEVQTITIRTGLVSDKAVVPGEWEPRVASTTGRRIVLTPPGAPPYGGVPAGRQETIMMVTGITPEPVRLRLPGNYVPDAFAANDDGLYVLDWMPPMAPDRYRVRIVNLADGQPSALWTREKLPIPDDQEERMEGLSRLAVYHPNLTMLYTLYTNQHPSGNAMVEEAKAFVHSLSIDQQWAVCVDLEEPFGEGPAAGHVITVSPDGRNFYVADITSGKMAVADTESLSIKRVTDTARRGGLAYASATNSRVFVGAENRIAVHDRDGNRRAEWATDRPITGLLVSADNLRLYVGQGDRLVWLDAASGARLGEAPVPGLTQLVRAL